MASEGVDLISVSQDFIRSQSIDIRFQGHNESK